MNRINLEFSENFTNNDIYFIEVVSDQIIINDNYDGIFILDSDCNIIKRLKLLDDLTIDVSFIKDREIVLYCYENRCLIHIDIDSYSYNIIFLSTDMKDIIFFSLYEWVDNNLVLLADSGRIFVHVNLLDNLVQVVQKDTINKFHFSIYKNWSKLNKFIIHKVYPQKFEAVVESDNVIKLMNYKNDTESILKIEPFETEPFYYHDIEVTTDCVVQISERQVSIWYVGKNIRLYPNSQDYSFLRGRIISIDDTNYLLLLVCSNSEPEQVTIEKYSFSTL